MLQQAYGEDCLSSTQCHEWYQRFKQGRTSIEEEPKSGRPSTSMDDDHVKKVPAVIRQNRHLTRKHTFVRACVRVCIIHKVLTILILQHTNTERG